MLSEEVLKTRSQNETEILKPGSREEESDKLIWNAQDPTLVDEKSLERQTHH
jgi:hypothetical protein